MSECMMKSITLPGECRGRVAYRVTFPNGEEGLEEFACQRDEHLGLVVAGVLGNGLGLPVKVELVP